MYKERIIKEKSLTYMDPSNLQHIFHKIILPWPAKLQFLCFQLTLLKSKLGDK